MKLRVSLSIIILAAVISLGAFSVISVKNFCSELISLTDEAGKNMDINTLDSIKSRWNEKINLLSALIPHEHIDEVTLTLYRAHAFLLSGNEDEYKAEIAEMIRQLHILERYDLPTIRSIF